MERKGVVLVVRRRSRVREQARRGRRVTADAMAPGFGRGPVSACRYIGTFPFEALGSSYRGILNGVEVRQMSVAVCERELVASSWLEGGTGARGRFRFEAASRTPPTLILSYPAPRIKLRCRRTGTTSHKCDIGVSDNCSKSQLISQVFFICVTYEISR